MTLDELQKLVDAATAGPWEYTGDSISTVGGNTVVGQERRGRPYMEYEELILGRVNGEFIAAARTYMPLLLAVARAAKIGAFHHNSCPWLDSKECGCSKQYVDVALAALEQA